MATKKTKKPAKRRTKQPKSTLPEHLENVHTTATGKALIKARGTGR